MKKIISLRLCLVIAFSMLAATLLSGHLQMKSSKEAMYNTSSIMINEVSQIVNGNDIELEQLKKNLKEDYFIRAKAVAYIIQNNPEFIGSQSEMKKIATLLQVDELHLFNEDGLLYAGSEPKYFNFTFNSGEQMQFFLPLLEDYSLQLCQEVTPNTAESKLMQYLALWSEDRKNIIQIGMEPIRLLEAMQKNELSYIFKMMTVEDGITIFAVDPIGGTILGSTDPTISGNNITDMGIDPAEISLYEKGHTAQDSENKNYCVAKPVGNMLVGVSYTYQKLYQNVPGNMALVVTSLFLLSIVIIMLLLRMLDNHVIFGIHEMLNGMHKISDGDLDYRVEVIDTPEFVQLSKGINSMVASLLETTGKLSLVFQNVNIEIAVFEYTPDMKRVQATSKIGNLLMLSERELLEALSDHEIFAKIIQKIRENPFKNEKDIYVHKTESLRYLKIKTYREKRSTFGIIVDVTEEVLEKQCIESERDIDFLTETLNRRAFFSEMSKLFPQCETPKIAALLMIDLDNLKYVNDTWGHKYGDQLLIKTADLLKSCIAPNKLVSRLSGDEFVLTIYGADTAEELQGYIDDLYATISSSSIDIPNGETTPIRMSGGYVFYSETMSDYNEMLRLADQTMYKVKRGTKGQFVQYKSDVIFPT